MGRKYWMAGLAVALTAAVGPASAAPNEDNQPPDAPSRYDASSPTGWMTSAASDRVQDIAQIGDTVYVAGTYAGIRPTRTGPVTAQGWLAAFDAATGAPRSTFAPVLNGTVYALEPSADGNRLYAGGAFTAVNGAVRNRLVALDPVTGATVTGFAANVGGGSVRSIVLRGSTLYVGGNFDSVGGQARTRLAAVDTATGLPLAGWRPAAGNTVLTLEMAPDGGRLYVGGRFTSVNGQPATANLAALDRASGLVDPVFAAQPGREVFDLLADDGGLVWAALGGVLGRADVYRAADGSLLTRHETSGDVETVERVGGLVYLGGHDIGPSEVEHIGVVDPAAPAIMDASLFDEPTTGGDGTWALHSTGRDLWVGGNVSGPYFGFARYPAAPDPPARVELLPVLSDWRYLDTAAAPDGWRTATFDDGAWSSGPAELGFGDSGEATVLRSGRGTYYFRRTFEVTDLATLTDLRLDLLADDGAAVYVNGTEVTRTNLPAGPLDDTTRASSGLAGNPEDTFQGFAVPVSSLVEGANSVAVEVHQNAAASSDLSFDARLSAVRDLPPVPDTRPPTVPAAAAADAVTEQSATLRWDPSSDDVAVDHYEVFQDDVLVGSPTASTLAVGGLAPSTTYTFTIEAVDAAGNRSGRSDPLTVTTPAPAPGGPVEPVARGATWRYRDDGWAGGDGSWRGLGFDDSTWRQGPAELGREDGGEATVVAGNGIVTYWFRRTFTVSGAASLRDLQLELSADDGAVAYLNGVEVARDNLPAGAITAATGAVNYRFGAAETVWSTFGVAPTALREGANVLAVEVHQAAGSTDLSFDARLSGTAGPTPAPDTTPPSVPAGLASPSQTDTTVEVTWVAATDDVAVDHYDVFVAGDAAGSAPTPAFAATGLAPTTTYSVEVEAVDGAGNRSGRSVPLTVTTGATPPGPVVVVPRRAVWRYRDGGAAPEAGWAQPGYDDSAWLRGPAILGREEGGEGTVLAPGSGVRWFRRTFSVGAAGAVSALRLDLVADDGAVVYLNGTEVARDNLPAGTVTPQTLAATYRTGVDERAVRTLPLAPAALVDGLNVLAVQLHQAAGSADASFDAALTATGAVADTTAPSPPTGLTSPAQTAGGVELAWAAATDDVGVDRYVVFVDGVTAGTTPGTTFTVTGLAPATAYSVEVEAVDAAGNRSPRTPGLAVTTAAPAPGPVTLIPLGDTWRYRNSGLPPPADWNQPAYDDSSWLEGPAELGREDGGEATVLAAGSGTRWFRRRFTVAAAGSVSSLVLELLADDGAVVYLNGVEVARDNLPAGPVTATTLATDYRFGIAETVRRTFTLPATGLVDGSNVLAVSLHQASGSTDASFDMSLVTG